MNQISSLISRNVDLYAQKDSFMKRLMSWNAIWEFKIK